MDDDDFDWTEWASLEAERKSDDPSWEKHLPEQESDRTVAKKACNFLFPGGAGRYERVPEDELRLADPDRLARYFRMTSLESVPEAADIHEKLSQPELLADALASGEEADLVFLLEWIYNYLPSCQVVDVEGSTVALIDRVLRSESESKLTGDLAELFARVLAKLIRKAGTDIRRVCFQHVVAESPISVAEKVLLEAAAEQGKWCVRPEMVKGTDAQLIIDGEAVESAIEVWSQRVRQSIAADALSREPRMHSILYRFAQLNFAFGETYTAVRKICATDEGLKKFIAPHVKGSPFNTVDTYSLVEDALELADRIRVSELNEEYSWLVELISLPDWEKAIGEQSTRLKGLRRGGRD